MKYILTSLLLVLPCFWNARVQASDLASHTYNIWLADLIRAGHLPGLSLTEIRTNVLFDLLEERAIHAFGYEYGEKLAITLPVLTFFWGAFTWIGAVTKTSPWPVAPLLAMFTYGWVFHMGFANFFWSLGFSLFAMALFETNRKYTWIPLLPAVVAHILPVTWALGLMLYALLYNRIAQRLRLLAAMLVLIPAGAASLALFIPVHWHISQALGMLGVDQLWLFDSWYGIFSVVILFFAALAIVRGVDIATIDSHFFFLSAMAVLSAPWIIRLPWYEGPLAFITHRMSLTAAIPLLAILARAAIPKFTPIASAVLAVIFFSSIYHETAVIDRMETSLRAAVQQVPRGARVVAKMPESRARFLNVYVHLTDRACIGHCFSYGNYEPATKQFRVRESGPNPYVAHDTVMSLNIQNAVHTTTPHDAPLYMFEWTGSSFKLRILQAGDRMSD